ncbi:hypothetical protein ERO13_D11G241500v2 [Gossypium hirsutum]|nr:hypothetical protein ERO13_D11G241500v2 [Gossypium hirsutum]
MSEAEQANSPKPPPYLEVLCKSSGKKTRFAAGTKAGFAVSLINRKLGIGAPVALHIESIREGEEPIIFGPDAVLVNYGNGWNLQTVSEMDFPGIGKGKHVRGFPTQIPNGKVITSSSIPFNVCCQAVFRLNNCQDDLINVFMTRKK